MSNIKKIVLSLVAIVLLLGASSVSASLAGTWRGEGTGSCFPHPGMEIYPWQDWKGEISEKEDIFKGEWRDKAGNHGTFEGKLVPSPIPEERRFEGEWTWDDPLSMSILPVVGGKFKMIFCIYSKECKGTWMTHWISISAVGSMQGKKVAD